MTISSVKQEVVLNAVEVCKFIIGSISDSASLLICLKFNFDSVSASINKVA